MVSGLIDREIPKIYQRNIALCKGRVCVLVGRNCGYKPSSQIAYLYKYYSTVGLLHVTLQFIVTEYRNCHGYTVGDKPTYICIYLINILLYYRFYSIMHMEQLKCRSFILYLFK